ncbi:MAG: hypothetical protein KAY24_00250 [Candidatus Eisenbacteria sp.]|nr:hypothetical protein [Candidatus Eisenbacteria bacterium]
MRGIFSKDSDPTRPDTLWVGRLDKEQADGLLAAIRLVGNPASRAKFYTANADGPGLLNLQEARLALAKAVAISTYQGESDEQAKED